VEAFFALIIAQIVILIAERTVMRALGLVPFL
jgi:hypothetical protein